jgi:hypothetical protein
MNADLRRRQPCAIGRLHRVDQVIDQGVEFQRAERRHRVRAAEQARVAHSQDLVDGHGACFVTGGA